MYIKRALDSKYSLNAIAGNRKHYQHFGSFPSQTLPFWVLNWTSPNVTIYNIMDSLVHSRVSLFILYLAFISVVECN